MRAMTFWILVSALAFVVALVIGLALIRARRGAEPAAAYDLRVYRDQLKEVDRDLARGVISDEDAERIRAEVSRRILAADAQVQHETATGQTGGRGALLAAIAAGLVTVGGSLALYAQIGAPGYGDLALADRMALAEEARANRPSQEEAEASLPAQVQRGDLSPDFVALMERLRETVAERPNDLQGHVLLARNEAAIGNFTAAYTAQARVIQIMGPGVTADAWADYADMLILAAGGYVSPRAEDALTRALQIDPQNGPARYYIGLMLSQNGRPDQAFAMWQQLLAEGPHSAAWIEPIRLQIEEMAFRAGIHNFVLPDPSDLLGPSQDQIDAAEEMTAEERMQMIEGMVSGLADRLATEGGPPQEWARLIGSLGVLGRQSDAIAVYNNALVTFADDDAAIEVIRGGARQAGLIP